MTKNGEFTFPTHSNCKKGGFQFPISELDVDTRSFALVSQEQQRAMQVPGPGSYGAGRDVLCNVNKMSSAKCISILKSERRERYGAEWLTEGIDLTPGPEQYENSRGFLGKSTTTLKQQGFNVQESTTPPRDHTKVNTTAVGQYNIPERQKGKNIKLNATKRIFTYWAPSMTPGPLGYDICAYHSIMASKIVRENFEDKKQRILLQREQEELRRKWRTKHKSTELEPKNDKESHTNVVIR